MIHLEECNVENTTINLVWTPPENCNVDCYIVEIDKLDREGDIHQERNFIKVYQGPRTKYSLKGLDYNVKVIAHVKSSNTAGESEPSDQVSLSTGKGSGFHDIVLYIATIPLPSSTPKRTKILLKILKTTRIM